MSDSKVPMTAVLSGRSVVVTGAGRGIGRAVALACAEAGANVVVADLGLSLSGDSDGDPVAAEVAREIVEAGGAAVGLSEDVRSLDGAQRLVDAAVDTWGSIDGVVCAAGVLRERMLFNMTEEDWDLVIDSHLKGTFTLFRAASQHMRRTRRGALIGFTSGQFVGSAAQSSYAAAKGGVVSLVRSAALGLHRYGVTANCVAPVARTRMSERNPTPHDGIGDPEDVAPLVVYLLSDLAKDITGQIYSVAGDRISVWNQPTRLREMRADASRWSVDEIARRLPSSVGSEPLPGLADVEVMLAAVAESGTEEAR